jgi:hypothetical protein
LYYTDKELEDEEPIEHRYGEASRAVRSGDRRGDAEQDEEDELAEEDELEEEYERRFNDNDYVRGRAGPSRLRGDNAMAPDG